MFLQSHDLTRVCHKVQISEISIGMFVTGIENNTRINLTNAGRVSSEAGIQSLLKNNIKFVWVDEGLSDSKIDFSTLKVLNLGNNVFSSLKLPASLKELKILELSENPQMTALSFSAALPNLKKCNLNSCQ